MIKYHTVIQIKTPPFGDVTNKIKNIEYYNIDGDKQFTHNYFDDFVAHTLWLL